MGALRATIRVTRRCWSAETRAPYGPGPKRCRSLQSHKRNIANMLRLVCNSIFPAFLMKTIAEAMMCDQSKQKGREMRHACNNSIPAQQ